MVDDQGGKKLLNFGRLRVSANLRAYILAQGHRPVFNKTLAEDEIVTGEEEVPGERTKPRQIVEPVDGQPDFDYFVETFQLYDEHLNLKLGAKFVVILPTIAISQVAPLRTTNQKSPIITTVKIPRTIQLRHLNPSPCHTDYSKCANLGDNDDKAESTDSAPRLSLACGRLLWSSFSLKEALKRTSFIT